MDDIVRRPPFLPPGTQGPGNWIWDGERWICGPCDDRPPFPPPGPGGPWCPPWFDPPQPPWYPGANGGVSFGLTAPSHPIRGHFWFDGTVLWMFDGATWVDVGVGGASSGGGGASTGSNPPSNPTDGQLWFNGSILLIWDGNAWVPVSQTRSYIQATAPPAPNPGDTWWDGTQMRIWDGSAWQLVGPGATTGPVATTGAALAINQPTDLSPGSNWAVLAFTASPYIDTQQGWDAVTKKYTPKKAGYYLCFLRNYYGGSGTTQSGSGIVKNDSGTFNDQAQYTVAVDGLSGIPNTQGAYLNAVGMVAMNGTTDFLRCWGYSDTTWYVMGGSEPTFEVFLFP